MSEKLPPKEKEEERGDESSSEESDEADCDAEKTEVVENEGTVVQTVVGPISEFQAIEENIPNHPAILFAGKRRTGKSTTCDNLMEKTMQHIPFGIVMSETTMNGFWQKRVPEALCFQGWREDILLALKARQVKMMAKYGAKDPRTFAFIILDDVIADQNAIRFSKTINSFFTEGRHLNITVMITTQYMKGIGPMLRGNMDIVFLQPIYGLGDRKTINELYAGWLPNRTFQELMDQLVYSKEAPDCTARHPKMEVSVMVVQDWRQTCDASLKFKWWKPVHSDEVPPYRLCHPEYWKERPEAQLGGAAGKNTPLNNKLCLADTLDEVSSVFRNTTGD